MVLTSYPYPNHALLPGCCSEGGSQPLCPSPLPWRLGYASRYKQHTLFPLELEVWESLSTKPHWGAWNRLGKGESTGESRKQSCSRSFNHT